MIRYAARRALSLILSFALVLGLTAGYLTITVHAATLSHEITGLNASYTNGTWTASGTTFIGSATGKAKGTCDDASAETSVLTLTNGNSSAAVLSFNYTKPTLGSGGYVRIDGTAVTAAGSFTKELAAGGSVTVEILSGNPGAYTSGVELRDIQLVVRRTVTMTFEPAAEGGSYSVDGTAVTETVTRTQDSTVSYSLLASPAAGYKFMGWFSSVDGFISQSASYTVMFDRDQTVTARFTAASSPVFETGDAWFDDLNEAVAYAVEHSISKITLIANGTLPAGEYTIPASKTLLIPYEGSHIASTVKPEIFASVTPTSPSAYLTLTMADGAHLQVNGALAVNAKVNSTNNGYTGAPSGKYGYIYMNAGSTITVARNANLYCWGYISGDGHVTAESGATVYEAFQIGDIRGGTATTNMNGNSQRVLPFTQYHVQ